MTSYVALLRAVNVGGTRKVAMADLRGMVEALGFTDVQTLLQSGNVVFRGAAASTTSLERRLETQAAKRLALQTDFIVRTADEWRAVVAGNPLAAAARRDPSRFLVIALKDPPTAAQGLALRRAVPAPEDLRVRGREIYLSSPNGISQSKVTALLMKKVLATVGTGRNWNTVLKLAALV